MRIIKYDLKALIKPNFKKAIRKFDFKLNEYYINIILYNYSFSVFKSKIEYIPRPINTILVII